MEYIDIALDSENIENLSRYDVAAVSVAGGGAMGTPGEVVVYYREGGKAYASSGNQMWGSVDMKLLDKKLHCFAKNKGWEEIYMGAGHSLFVNHTDFPELMRQFEGKYEDEVGMMHKDVIMKALFKDSIQGNRGNRRQRYREIAAETVQITRDGFYFVDGEKYTFDMPYDYLTEVQVLDPDYVEDLVENEDGFFDDYDTEGARCVIRVVNMDSYDANYQYAVSDRALVLNFANAHHPGGGFLNGASAQEESLCRCSTLYASINSEKASEMYDYNNENPDPFDSDYILISPYVTVFRTGDCELTRDNFNTAVLTMPAPNLNGLAKGVDKDKLHANMLYKIESMLAFAPREDYDVLILGAWGCGAFGHDAKDVAGYFKEALVDMEYYKYFKKIIFAVYDTTPEQYNYRAFLDVFGEYRILEDPVGMTREEMIEEIKNFCEEMKVPYPNGFPDGMTDEEMRQFIETWDEFDPFPDV